MSILSEDPQPSSRSLENEQIAVEIATIHAQSRRTYGSPRIRMELRKSGRRVGRRRVARIMKRCRLFGRSRTRRKPRTTDSEHE